MPKRPETPHELTCNQLMSLLAVHRGTLPLEHAMGTRGLDLYHIAHRGLVSQQGDGWGTTEKGAALVAAVLAVAKEHANA